MTARIVAIVMRFSLVAHPLAYDTLNKDLEDYPGNDLLAEIQDDQIRPAPVSAGLFVE